MSSALRLLMRSQKNRTDFQQTRGLLRPPKNLPFRGIYRKDGEVARKDELLVCQFRMNYHPGLNVYYENDRGEKLLRADCDGIVRITTENASPDFSIPEMGVYQNRPDAELKKLTFNVIPFEMSKKFTLKTEI